MAFGRIKRAMSAAVMVTGSTVVYKLLRSLRDSVRSYRLTQFDVARAEFTFEDVEIVKNPNEAKFPMVDSMDMKVDKLFIKFRPFTMQIKECAMQGISGNVSLKLDKAFVLPAPIKTAVVSATATTRAVARPLEPSDTSENLASLSRDPDSEADRHSGPVKTNPIHIRSLNSISISDCRLQISDPSTGVQFPLVVERLQGHRFRIGFSFLDIMFRTNTKASIDGHTFETHTLGDDGIGECNVTLPAHHFTGYIPDPSFFHFLHPRSTVELHISNAQSCDDDPAQPILLNWSVHLHDTQLAAEQSTDNSDSPITTNPTTQLSSRPTDRTTLPFLIQSYLKDYKQRPLQFQTMTSRKQFEGAITPHSARMWHTLSDGMAAELGRFYNQLFGKGP